MSVTVFYKDEVIARGSPEEFAGALRDLLRGDVPQAHQRALEARTPEVEGEGDLDLPPGNGAEASLAPEAALPVPKRHQHVDEDRGRVGQEDAGQRRQKILIPVDFEKIKREAVRVEDPDPSDRPFDFFRMVHEVGAEIVRPLGTPTLEQGSNAGKVHIPERDGSGVEDFAVAVLADHGSHAK